MKTNTFLLSYIGFGFIYLLIILIGMEDVAWFLKPFLIPFLLFAVYFYNDFLSKKFLLTALFFSWIGDIILLFAERDELFFISGLIAFLISHIVYILLFNKQLKEKNKRNKAFYWIGVTLIIVYLFVMLTILLPSLGDLQLPVLVYAIVLSTMLLFAFKGFLSWTKPANSYVLLGAIIFVSSDSILAFDKFHEPIAMSSFLIMVTYLAAQFLIVNGILKLNQKK
ncbi:lysoplasmalogenase [Flavobacterium granuli]|uniref:Membrane protein YhhN n=1 Tax=Flavobacterium granuli TaxID=280093 RepID=A0A1M5R9S9_9FLAO|nr:lysoplasmalogenase [Flavobacterium granuli]PRZ21666.1 putative membrane protein YhhN [Flavobacterium granuli]SHH23085.1 Uncharacterized membrane protein YhhN [Flavobacterium granuli]